MNRVSGVCARAVVAALVVLALVDLGGCARKTGDRGSAASSAPARKVELVEFHAPWNPACRMQAPVVDRLAENYKGRAVVRRIDVEADPGAAAAFGVKSYPAFVVLVDGKERRRMSGLQAEKELAAALDEALE